nr:PREDICTED: fibrous sheath-interacting protein 2 [Linepithema humile]
MIPGPKGAYNLTRRKIGRTLWTTGGSKTDFDLSDPYCREIRFPYEPLHDEHLYKFFSRPSNLKCLLKADLITKNMDVKCSLRDYNAYRKYLRKKHADCIKRELKKRNCLFVEKTALRFSEDQARKEAERLKKKKKFAEDRQRLVKEQLLQQELKVQKQREKAYKTVQRLKLLKLLKQEERRLKNVKRKEHAERIQQRYKIVRHKVIDIKVNWKIKNKARKKARNKRLMDIKQQKRKIMEERWRKKQHFQKEDIAIQKMLLQCIDTQRQKFIENYNKKINKETARMQTQSAKNPVNPLTIHGSVSFGDQSEKFNVCKTKIQFAALSSLKSGCKPV